MPEIVISVHQFSYLCFDSHADLHFITCCRMFSSSRSTDGSVFFRTTFTTLLFPGSDPNSTESDGGDEITLGELIEQEQEKRELTFVTHVRQTSPTLLVEPHSVHCSSSTGICVLSVRCVLAPVFKCQRTAVHPFPGVSVEADPKRFRRDH